MTAIEARTVTYRTGDYHGDGSDLHIWEGISDGETVAALYIARATGEIMNVEVDQDHRRQGWATALYEAATCQIAVYHAPVAHRTPEGDAFAQAVGGPVADYPCNCHGCDITEEDEDY